MAGVGNGVKIRATARKQWFDQEDAPNLQTLSANARLDDKSGVGAILYNDQNGYHSQKGLYLTYAHHLRFSRSNLDLNQLSFGLSFGVIQSELDESTFDPTDFDPIIAGIKQSSAYYNIDFGMSYNYFEFYAHVAVKNALFRNRNINGEFESSNQRNYLMSFGYVLAGTSDWSFEPSVLFQAKEFTTEKAIDGNIKVYKKMDFGRLWGGISYRTSFDGAAFLNGNKVDSQRLQWVSPVLGVNYDNFMFAYTYTNQMGNLQFDNGGFHQITIGLDLFKGKEPYDCNCPAVNF
jgi:type IX secretion system PorP/SprF family membrane protein